MRVQRNSVKKIELIKSVVDGKSYYTARLFDDFKVLPYMAMEGEDKSKDPMVAFDCEMVITQTELEFADDTQALYFFESNFKEEFKLAKYIEDYRRKLEESMEARQNLDSFDYVSIKMVEACMQEFLRFYNRAIEGETVSFNDFLISVGPTISKLVSEKGADFFGSRNKQRKIASGR